VAPDAVRGTPAANPFEGMAGPVAPEDPAALAASLRRRLVEGVRNALDASAAARMSPEAVRTRLLEMSEAPTDTTRETVGNPHEVGSRAWVEYGRETGIWFEVPMRALEELLDGHAIRPDPSQPNVDLRHEEIVRREARPPAPEPGGGAAPVEPRMPWRVRPSGPPVAPPSPSEPLPAIDVRAPGVRSFEQEVVLSYLLQIARASSFLAAAASAGAEPEELAALAGGALRRGRLDLHVGPDFADRLENDRHFDRAAGRQAVANQAFWLQVRAGDQDITLGNVHDLLPVAPKESFRAFAQDSRIRLNVDAAGDRMMQELVELARTLGVEVFDEPQKQREAVATAIGRVRRDHGMSFVRLAMADGGPERARELEDEMRQLLDLAYDDLDALAARVG